MTHIMVDLEELRYHIGENPFVSERTLRKAGVITTKPKKPDESPVVEVVPKVYTTVAHGGYFDSQAGFALSNPKVGTPFYYYNLEHPPSFETGTIEIEVIPPPVEVFSNSVHGLTPPPLPNIASLTKLEATGGKKPALVIKKVEKVAAPEPELTGWNAIMAEMEKRKNGLLKKVDPPAPKPAPSKAAAPKKNKKDFKDIMEELAYKLAKMRGDVVDGDDDDDDKPDSGAKVSFDAPAEPKAAELTVSTGLRKLNSKPDLSSLLAKIKPAPATPGKPGAALAAAAPAVEVGLEGQMVGKPAVTSTTPILYPPLLPTSWPPIPVLPPPEPVKVEAPPAAPVEPEIKIVPIPEGYYMPEVQKGSVKPGKYVYGGIITQALYDTLIKEIPPKKKKIPKKVHIVSAPSHHVNKLTMDDLPVPNDFQKQIDRLKKAQDLRDERSKLEKDKELRSYQTPIEPIVSTPKKSIGPTQPKSYVSHVDKRIEKKNFTFRQNSDIQAIKSNCNTPVRKDFSYDNPIDNWIGNLRSETDATLSATGTSASAAVSGRKTPIKSSSRVDETQYDSNGDIVEHIYEDDINFTGYDSGVSYTTTSESQQYLSDLRPQVVPKAPTLRIDDVVSRRQSKQASRARDEELRQQHEDNRVKLIKLKLKQKAMQTAQEAGVYRPTSRYHRHQKMINNYGQRSDSGLNLQQITQQSFNEYSAHHMNNAIVRRKAIESPTVEYYIPTDLDYYYQDRSENQQYSF